jgi:DNA polymerase III epsilon subunit-like protein
MALIIDVETTGLPDFGTLAYGQYPSYESLDNYNSSRVVQLSMMVCNEKLDPMEMFDFIIKSDGFVIENSNFHGITNEISLEKGIMFSDVALILSQQLKKVSHIIAHNAMFDINIIKSELYRLSMNSLIQEINSKQILCTMKETKKIVRAKNKYDRVKDPSLAELYKFAVGKDIENAHNSNYDVINLHLAIKNLCTTGALNIPCKYVIEEELFQESDLNPIQEPYPYPVSKQLHLIEVKINTLVNQMGCIPFDYISDAEIAECIRQQIFLDESCIYNGSGDSFSHSNNKTFDVIKIATIVNEINNGTYNHDYPIPVWDDGDDDNPIYDTDGNGWYQIRAFYYCQKNIRLSVWRSG